MSNQQQSSVNVVLMAIVGVLVGFIGGYFIGQNMAPAANIAAGTLAAGSAPCPHTLDAKDQWIIAGFRCPGTDTMQVPLLGCHCPTAHGIEDKVKSEIAAGQTGQQVRDGLMAEYHARLNYK